MAGHESAGVSECFKAARATIYPVLFIQPKILNQFFHVYLERNIGRVSDDVCGNYIQEHRLSDQAITSFGNSRVYCRNKFNDCGICKMLLWQSERIPMLRTLVSDSF